MIYYYKSQVLSSRYTPIDFIKDFLKEVVFGILIWVLCKIGRVLVNRYKSPLKGYMHALKITIEGIYTLFHAWIIIFWYYPQLISLCQLLGTKPKKGRLLNMSRVVVKSIDQLLLNWSLTIKFYSCRPFVSAVQTAIIHFNNVALYRLSQFFCARFTIYTVHTYPRPF